MEMGSIYAQLLIENLLHVHALANMHRSSGNKEYRTAAANWIPALEKGFANLKHELTKS